MSSMTGVLSPSLPLQVQRTNGGWISNFSALPCDLVRLYRWFPSILNHPPYAWHGPQWCAWQPVLNASGAFTYTVHGLLPLLSLGILTTRG
ncbi:hypothetical protein GGQ85_004075 [Nitrobacter vulgaris]|jgi:hypothetical protein|nr:hypothetical protein [Nitrobacter vulgaris]